jgi:cysteine desulfurase/selenocysteine lyase
VTPKNLAVDRSDAHRLDPYKLREEFPILARKVHGKPLVYLDNAASTQKPTAVIDAVEWYYKSHYSNVHRGLHKLSSEATEAFDAARSKIQRFIGARNKNEIVFTSGTTGSINLVAHSFGARFVGADDEILITHMEHHSNIVPWQLLCERTGARLRVAPINDAGELILDEYDKLLGPRTKLVAVVHTSNALGTRNPLEHVIRTAHDAGIPVLVDGAQAVAHENVDVAEMDCDFFAFSGHKMFAPTGIGVLYGKSEWLEQMPPFLGGGEMIRSVTLEKSTFKAPPIRFEAGTPDIAGAIGIGAAADWLESIGLDRIAAHDDELLDYTTRRLVEIPRVRLIGTAGDKSSIVSFVLDDIHPHDVGTVIDLEGVAVRAGHHCAQPVMDRFGVPATVRASLACYNTPEDVDALVAGIHRVIEVLG